MEDCVVAKCLGDCDGARAFGVWAGARGLGDCGVWGLEDVFAEDSRGD